MASLGVIVDLIDVLTSENVFEEAGKRLVWRQLVVVLGFVAQLLEFASARLPSSVPSLRKFE